MRRRAKNWGCGSRVKHQAKPRGLIPESRGAEMKTRLVLIAFRRLRIDRRADFCRDCRDDHGCYCQE
jgi:hypothetical protein